jgi:hypothetical protein
VFLELAVLLRDLLLQLFDIGGLDRDRIDRRAAVALARPPSSVDDLDWTSGGGF